MLARVWRGRVMIGALASLVSLAGTSAASADVKVPAVIADNMVLQQSASVPIWGWADPGEEVAVTPSWMTQAVKTRGGADGSWRVMVQTPAASATVGTAADAKPGVSAKPLFKKFTVTISGKNTLTINNVLIGEVWLCSGQSNMEWPLAATDGAEEAIQNANYPYIRLFTVGNAVAVTPQKDCAGQWSMCSPESAKNFSAVGYHFGEILYKTLDVPIGVIASDWGGTPAEAWASETTMRTFPEFAGQLKMCEEIRARQQGGGGSEQADFAAWLKQLDETDVGSRDPKIDPRGGWFAPGYDDSAWTAINVPGEWGGDLANFDGFMWMRTDFEIPGGDAGAKFDNVVLTMGPIDDCDTVWVNGVRVADSMKGDMFNKPRQYKLPAGTIKPGRNVIAIRVLDTGVTGGVTGDPALNALHIKTGADTETAVPLAKAWRGMKGSAWSELPKRPQTLAPSPWLASNLYNGMIAPIAGYGMRGALWYQGESNRDRAFQYRLLFPAMITDWRMQWARAIGGGATDKNVFPFYFVQIAPFGYGGDTGQAAELREAQTRTLALPNTGMAVTMDIGNPADIHPRNKIDVARRLSLWALAKTYGREGIEYSGPMYKSMRVQNNRVFLSFDHAEKGLDSGGAPLTCFTIAGEDGKFVPAQASIEGKEIAVWNSDLLKPVAVRFAWGAADQPNLKSKAGLPAPSFRTDDWPMITQPKEGTTGKPGARSTLRLEKGRKLVLQAPIDRWDEAIPLGNGLLGGLVWGKDNLINLSLDRGDLWDLRIPEIMKRPDWNYETMRKLVAAKDQATISEYFDKPYDSLFPTKLPGGRLVIHLDEKMKVKEFALDLPSAEATVDIGTTLRAHFNAMMPVGFVTYIGPKPKLELVRPKGLDLLGYKPAQFGREGGADSWFQWMKQDTLSLTADGKPLTYVVAVAARCDTRGSRVNTIAVTITSTQDTPEPLDLARERLEDALTAGYDGAKVGHAAWWDAFWKTSSVQVPDESIQAHYDLCKYFYGSASRAEGPTAGPPIPLQGVWTADEGGLPPWKGDFHNDLNTQMTYLAYHVAGLTEAGKSWLDFNTKLLPRYERFAKEFFGVGGAAVPGVMTLTGDPMAGWGMYSLSPTQGAWVAQSFHMHWKYTQDEKSLSEADKFVPAIAIGLASLLRWNGKTDDLAKGLPIPPPTLPLSSSPEIHDNSLRAWLEPNSNYDAALISSVLFQAEQLSQEYEKRHPNNGVRGISFLEHLTQGLGDQHFDTEPETSVLTFAKGEPYTHSHRHFSHTMAIHPLMLMTIENGPAHARIVNASIDRILEKGTSEWCGYSFSWMSCILATIARPEQSLDYLEKYMRGFILRNGFHCNGDQSGEGLSNFTYRPFTLEGNFLAMQAVHDMLIQSWGGRLRIFPAVSARWADASFTDLRAEGGFKVSAKREGGKTAWVSVTATVDQTLRLRNPFAGAGGSVKWSRDDLSFIDGDYFVKMKAGETVTGTLIAR